MEYDLVMQRAAEQRMRMANHSSVSCALHTRIEQAFEPTCGPGEKQ